MEAKDEIIIELLLANRILKKQVKDNEESLSYWYKKNDKLEEELKRLKPEENE
tara:strand:+ start:1007 stop:1165 length:159 start_codon:yes stop_codon:yes gene_type:complete